MKDKLKEELKIYFEAPKPREKRDFVRKYGVPQVNWFHLVGIQAGYISKRVWVFSAVLCIVTFSFIEMVEARHAGMVLALIPFLVMLSVTESIRSYRYGMEELELATRFSLKSIVMSRMILLGVVNFAVLLCLMLVLGCKAQINVLYIMVPYFLTAGGGLYIVRKVRGNESTFLCFVLSALVCVLELYLPWQFTELFTREYVEVWVLIFIAGVVVTARESYRFIRMTEVLAWN